jgi:hypothetical protein
VRGSGFRGVKDYLHNSRTVAQVYEDQLPEITATVNPTRHCHILVKVSLADFATVDGFEHR